MRRSAVATAVLIGALLFTQHGQAHKGITSKFTYNVEVYPIFLNRCGRCHVDGGVAPMSLLKYEDAFPWAESLRAELMTKADSATRRTAAERGAEDFVSAAHRQISARELDIILDWASGGSPEGDKSLAPSAVSLSNEWTHGTPHLVVQMEKPFEMAPDALQSTQEFVLPIPLETPQAAAQFDLLPGNASIVRSATVSIRSKEGQIRALGTWFPRQTPVPLALKPPVRLEPGAELIARIHYKKTWKAEGLLVTDRTAIGFYFAK
jgi:hypothetical protein